ncbi:ComF family protein [Reichenbachiella carrageenanivorans]|uniref:ComF family protein n=1 Tax=Reichenbachiella carrageenanivorans TaxID=2979869 RepID=A0ABY6D3S1_9BACT|nr:phosphoribosyltransferase family protein [Reichenbachiella carrageenanivorans]UXX80434.1 ComF family protein [Reichenbachiella carrageenanivorans]
MIKKYWKDFLSLIYPNVCYNCDVALVEGEEKICLRCYRDFPLTKYHLTVPNPLVQMCSGNEKVKGAFCYMKFNKHGIAQLMLHELKYKGNISMGLALGQWFARYIQTELKEAEIDVIIPVPLHKAKQRKRGYNQSEVLARGMNKITGISIVRQALIRTKNVSTQTKKGKVERWQNVDDLYQVINAEQLEGKNVLLLDDVITTGATIAAAAEVLSVSGVGQIYLGCIASGK